jgi:FkbM family methyltransferase
MQKRSFGYNIFQGIRMRWNKLFHNPYSSVNVGPLRKIYFKHLNAGRIRVHSLFGKDLYYFSPTELLHGLKEIFIDEIYKQKLPLKPFIIDCGANIGLSVIYLKRLFPDAEIVAFEPDEKNFELLKKNVESFGFSQVQLRKEAVWIENTTIQFADEGSMSSRIDTESSTNTVDVQAIRLKDFLNKRVDFLKIDIEGAEFKVMNDIIDNLHFIESLFLEYHGSFKENGELTQLFSMLATKGFMYYIKEATSVYNTPLERSAGNKLPYDIQLNIFCFREKSSTVK